MEMTIEGLLDVADVLYLRYSTDTDLFAAIIIAHHFALKTALSERQRRSGAVERVF